MASYGTDIALTAAQYAGIAITSNPLGASVAATIGTFFLPGITAGTSTAAISGAVFAGSWLLAGVALPAIGFLFCASFLVPPERGHLYRALALVVGLANVIACAGIAAAALRATGVATSFTATALCVLAGTGVCMVGVGVLAAAVATCVCTGIGDIAHDGRGNEFAAGLWGAR